MYEYSATITEIIDGDTADARIDCGFHIYHVLRLRLNGINTPELHSKDPHEVASAQKAKARLAELVNGKDVTIKTYKDRTEKYGRMLADITLDGKSINDQMIAEGLAVSYHGEKRS